MSQNISNGNIRVPTLICNNNDIINSLQKMKRNPIAEDILVFLWITDLKNYRFYKSAQIAMGFFCFHILFLSIVFQPPPSLPPKSANYCGSRTVHLCSV